MEMETIKTMSIAVKQSPSDRMFIAVRGEIDLDPVYGRQGNCVASRELTNWLSSKVL